MTTESAAPGFRGLPRAPECPFCGERETELMNPFGSHASVSTFWCRGCRSPFEVLKWARSAVADDERKKP